MVKNTAMMTHFSLAPILIIAMGIVGGVCGDTVEVSDAQKLIDLFSDATTTTFHANIVVTADIDFSSSNLALPLGAFSNGTCVAFSGVIHGNGHSIKGLVMDNMKNEGYKNAGLFCSLNDAVVESLVIDSSCSFTGEYAGGLSVLLGGSLTVKNTINNGVVSGTKRVGGFIGDVKYLKQEIVVSFEDCANHGIITANRGNVGGFVGYISDNDNVTLTISHSINNGNITGGYCVGGFVGYISSNTIITTTISHSTNNGIITAIEGNAGGFVGEICYNTNMTLTISHSINNGNVTGSVQDVGGFVGYIDDNNITVSISHSTNNGIITGEYTPGGFVGYINDNNITVSILHSINNGIVTGSAGYAGGFVGEICYNTNMTLTISHSTNNGNVTGSEGYVGGFVGYIDWNNITVSISKSTNNGIVTGKYGVGGFVGSIYTDPESNFITLSIINNANKGNVSANDVACGLFCVESEMNSNMSTTVENSINKGNVNASTHAYGITNIITMARNVVSMGDVNGSSNSHTFWDSFIDVDLFIGLEDKCLNCSENATRVRLNTTTGFYEVIGTGEHVDDILNEQSEQNGYGMLWSKELELVDEWVKPSSQSESSTSYSVVSQSTPLSMAANCMFSPFIIATVLVFICIIDF